MNVLRFIALATALVLSGCVQVPERIDVNVNVDKHKNGDRQPTTHQYPQQQPEEEEDD